MTDAEVAKLRLLVLNWRDKLAYMGIGHWRLQQIHVVAETPGGPNASATVWFSTAYDTCEFYFKESYVLEASVAELEETIIHEWLHVAWRDMDAAVDSARDWFPYGAWDTYQERLNHEREGIIERTARTIYQHSKRKC